MKHLICLIILICLTSCNENIFESKEDFLNYLNDPDNGYFQNKNINGFNVSLTYRPTDLLVHQEIGTSMDYSKIEKLRAKYKDYMYFTLGLSSNGKELLNTLPGNKNEYGDLLNQLVFGMNEKIHLYTSQKDTIQMLDYILPRLYGMSKSNSLLLIFPKLENLPKEDILSLTIEDMGTNSGEIKFKIPNHKIINQPSLTFQ